MANGIFRSRLVNCGVADGWVENQLREAEQALWLSAGQPFITMRVRQCAFLQEAEARCVYLQITHFTMNTSWSLTFLLSHQRLETTPAWNTFLCNKQKVLGNKAVQAFRASTFPKKIKRGSLKGRLWPLATPNPFRCCHSLLPSISFSKFKSGLSKHRSISKSVCESKERRLVLSGAQVILDSSRLSTSPSFSKQKFTMRTNF